MIISGELHRKIPFKEIAMIDLREAAPGYHLSRFRKRNRYRYNSRQQYTAAERIFVGFVANLLLVFTLSERERRMDDWTDDTSLRRRKKKQWANG